MIVGSKLPAEEGFKMEKRIALVAVILVGTLMLGITAAGCGKNDNAGKNGNQTTPGDGAQSQETVQLFFLKGEAFYAVDRPVEKKGAAEAVDELLKGPTDAEKGQGVSTSIPEGTKLNKITIEDGVAKADFSKELKNFGGGSAIVQSMVNQINNTIIANDPSVKSVEITIEGVSSDEALQP